MSTPKGDPIINELVEKALAAAAIDARFGDKLLQCTDFREALNMFNTYIISEGGDPDALLREWEVII